MFIEEVPGKIGMSEMSSASTQPVAHMSTAGVRRLAYGVNQFLGLVATYS